MIFLQKQHDIHLAAMACLPGSQAHQLALV